MLSRPDGSVFKQFSYDSFGNVLEEQGADVHIHIGFAGGLTDQDTGLVRFGFRDYDPETGRFTCKDPAGDTGGDHDLYDYCVDDPVNALDPKGLLGQPLKYLATRGVAGKVAGKIEEGGIFSPKTAHAPGIEGTGEKRLQEISEEIAEIEQKIVDGDATGADYARLDELQKEMQMLTDGYTTEPWQESYWE